MLASASYGLPVFSSTAASDSNHSRSGSLQVTNMGAVPWYRKWPFEPWSFCGRVIGTALPSNQRWSWLLLAAPGCFWLLLAASGHSWLRLAAPCYSPGCYHTCVYGFMGTKFSYDTEHIAYNCIRSLCSRHPLDPLQSHFEPPLSQMRPRGSSPEPR